ncbi:MAG: ATP-binding protein [Planctomycetaceae bacterium]
MPHATLLVVHGADQGTRLQLDATPVSIGRGARNEIRILDTEVSRQHAIVRHDDEAFHITDRNSSNGTFVNGEAVRTHRLKSGDRVQIGRTVMLFEQRNDSDDRTRSVAEWVDLVGRQGVEDRSSIVGQADQDSHLMVDATLPGGANQALAQMVANLQALYRIAEEAVSSSISLDQMLQRILDLSIDVVGADRGCMLLAEGGGGEPAPHAFSHRRGRGDAARMPVSRSIVDYVMHHGQGVRTSDARRDQRFEPGQSILQAGIREAICVPMQGRYELLGVVYLDTTTPPERVVIEGDAHQFDDEKLRLMVAIARQCALAIENHRYQEAYVKAERLAAMGQTIAMLSHHIKNILQGVRGGSYLIDMGLNDHDEALVRKGWGIVEKNQNKIYNLVLDMLTFSKERQPVLAQADLDETVGEVCELMQARAAEAGIEFEYHPAANLPLTTFDAEGIHRAVLNVVNNAVDAVEGAPDGRIVVETAYEQAADELRVIVTDNGPGIAPDQIERIFNVFESTKGARGTGLGLAVSRKIVREHGGEIRVESRPGEGCRFIVAWPRIDDEHRPHEPMTQA